ncbi:MAG: hypothetical protein ACFFBT_13465 [Promethearchaeota archaeon]
MVQVLEKPEQVILIKLPEIKGVAKKVKLKKVKAENVSAKGFSKYREGLICINKLKANLDARSYGMRLNSF